MKQLAKESRDSIVKIPIWLNPKKYVVLISFLFSGKKDICTSSWVHWDGGLRLGLVLCNYLHTIYDILLTVSLCRSWSSIHGRDSQVKLDFIYFLASAWYVEYNDFFVTNNFCKKSKVRKLNAFAFHDYSTSQALQSRGGQYCCINYIRPLTK